MLTELKQGSKVVGVKQTKEIEKLRFSDYLIIYLQRLRMRYRRA